MGIRFADGALLPVVLGRWLGRGLFTGAMYGHERGGVVTVAMDADVRRTRAMVLRQVRSGLHVDGVRFGRDSREAPVLAADHGVHARAKRQDSKQQGGDQPP